MLLTDSVRFYKLVSLEFVICCSIVLSPFVGVDNLTDDTLFEVAFFGEI